ncbi:MAG: HD domain-containing protein, partial [Halobacteriovoraceae bacterium]|nr:HD domain-containing protein [Halobacteriovoraceae bacterium]
MKRVMQFIHLAEKLKTEKRRGRTSNNDRESVAEHSWRVSLLICVYNKCLDQKIDLEKALKIAIIHDLAESITGDIPIYITQSNKTLRDIKTVHEREAIKKIKKILPEESAEEIINLWEEYESGKTYEAKVVKAFDKIEAQVQQNEANFSNWNDFDLKHAPTLLDKYCHFDSFLLKLAKEVQDESIRKMKQEIDNSTLELPSEKIYQLTTVKYFERTTQNNLELCSQLTVDKEGNAMTEAFLSKKIRGTDWFENLTHNLKLEVLKGLQQKHCMEIKDSGKIIDHGLECLIELMQTPLFQEAIYDPIRSYKRFTPEVLDKMFEMLSARSPSFIRFPEITKEDFSTRTFFSTLLGEGGHVAPAFLFYNDLEKLWDVFQLDSTGYTHFFVDPGKQDPIDQFMVEYAEFKPRVHRIATDRQKSRWECFTVACWDIEVVDRLHSEGFDWIQHFTAINDGIEGIPLHHELMCVDQWGRFNPK